MHCFTASRVWSDGKHQGVFVVVVGDSPWSRATPPTPTLMRDPRLFEPWAFLGSGHQFGNRGPMRSNQWVTAMRRFTTNFGLQFCFRFSFRWFSQFGLDSVQCWRKCYWKIEKSQSIKNLWNPLPLEKQFENMISVKFGEIFAKIQKKMSENEIRSTRLGSRISRHKIANRFKNQTWNDSRFSVLTKLSVITNRVLF